MIKLINLTPHTITLRGSQGDISIEPDPRGPARVTSSPGSPIGEVLGVPVFSAPTFGAIEGLPSPNKGEVFIVSAIVAGRLPVKRGDVVSPGTGPQDGAIRKDGQIVAVTRLISSISKRVFSNCPLCGEDISSCQDRCGAAP